MFLSFQNILTGLRNVSAADIIPTPSVSVQPQIYIPTLTPTPGKQNIVTGVTSFLGKTPFEYVSIAFTVDYHMSVANPKEKINDNYDLSNTFLYLERCKMKRYINEIYESRIHSTQIILCSIASQYERMPVYIANSLAEVEYGNLKYGCQLIHLTNKDKIKNLTDLRRAVSELKSVFTKNIEPKELESYAFRFIVYIKLQDRPGHGPFYIEVYTELFVPHFNEDGYKVTLTWPMSNDYHVIWR